MSTISETTSPQTTPALTPEALVEHLRALRTQIADVTPLTAEQRRALQGRARASNEILQASINVLGAMEVISTAVGQPPAEVRQLHDEANRWTAVEDELRVMLKGVAGANLIRRQRVVFAATQAAGIGVQLARDPANAVLVPHVEEIKRLRRLSRRKKPAPDKAASGKKTSGKTPPAKTDPAQTPPADAAEDPK